MWKNLSGCCQRRCQRAKTDNSAVPREGAKTQRAQRLEKLKNWLIAFPITKCSTFEKLNNMEAEELSLIAINTAMNIHRKLGPGLMESIYEEVFYIELLKQNVQVERQKTIPIYWDGRLLKNNLKVDLILGEKLIVELKTVECLNEVHFKQLLTYLRLSNIELGLLINFKVPMLKNGIRRVINTKSIRVGR